MKLITVTTLSVPASGRAQHPRSGTKAVDIGSYDKRIGKINMIMKKTVLVLVTALIASPILAGAAGSNKRAEESANALEANIIATSIRDKGYPCKAIQKMTRIERDNPAIRSAWQVRCDGGQSYRVVYLGDRGFEVQAAQ